jgi:hypothetical protein
MSELEVTTSHLRRAAVVYVRQSTLMQVDRNQESTARQYQLADRAAGLGWARGAVMHAERIPDPGVPSKL